MKAEWKYKIPLVVCDAGDGDADEVDAANGADIYHVVEDFARRNGVLWNGTGDGNAVFAYDNEAYIVPVAKIGKFVRHACNWFANGITDYATDEDESIALVNVTVENVQGISRDTFTLTVSWRDHNYTLRMLHIPRPGDEAFYDWDVPETKG